MTIIVCNYMVIAYIYISTTPINTYNRHTTNPTQRYPPRWIIWVRSYIMLITPTVLTVAHFQYFSVPSFINTMIIHNTISHSSNITTWFIHTITHTTMESRNRRSITSDIVVWNILRPTMTLDSPDILTYTHGLFFTLTSANYSYTTMNVIDHICIRIYRDLIT